MAEQTPRISIIEYAKRLADTAACRSEDPWNKVGAVAFDINNRVISTAYNGLAMKKHLTPEQWADREARLHHVIHAEQNLCSGFKRGEAMWVYCTLSPCFSCLKLLEAHDVRNVYFSEWYNREDVRPLLRFVNLNLHHYAGGKSVLVSS